MQRAILFLSSLFFVVSNASGKQELPEIRNDCWIIQQSGSTASLRGISAASASVCWATGSGGTVLRTVDGGESWKNVPPGDSGMMDFRDVHAWDADNAIIMCAGEPDRLYRTADGGNSWKVVYEHRDSAAFFDGIAFERVGERGYLMGDPLDGRLFLLFTQDNGNTWAQLPPEEMPELPTGIAGFAASGTNLCVTQTGLLFVGLGGKPEEPAGAGSMIAFMKIGSNGVSLGNTPIPTGESAGIFSVIDVESANGRIIAVGGDYQRTEVAGDNIAISDDSGLTWRLPKGDPPSGFRSVVVVVQPAGEKETWLLAIGPSGTDRSGDSGETWQAVSSTGFHTASFVRGTEIGWAAGSGGRIGKWRKSN